MSSGLLPRALGIRFSLDVMQPMCCVKIISLPDTWHKKVQTLLQLKPSHWPPQQTPLHKIPASCHWKGANFLTTSSLSTERFLVLKKGCEDCDMVTGWRL